MTMHEQFSDNYGYYYKLLAQAGDALLAAQTATGQVHPAIEAVRFETAPDTTYLHSLSDAGAPEIVAISGVRLGPDEEPAGHIVTVFEPAVRTPLGKSWERYRPTPEDGDPTQVPLWFYGDEPVPAPGQQDFDARAWAEGRLSAPEANNMHQFVTGVAEALVPPPEAEPQPEQSRTARILGRLGLGRFLRSN